ncbi:MAG: shikimate kinase [Deltaproteobacteria bacterium]|nr:shikimate kinase [Deltaproteobacteria bacterium]
MNIYLIGYRCCGKTSVGKALSRLLDRPFLDTDEAVVQKAGMTISEMVARNGWDAFRDMEKSIITQTTLLDHHIIATGGGVILNPDNVRNMKKAGRVIWLRVSPETVRERMAADLQTLIQRPGLTPTGSMNEIETVLFERQPLYEKASDAILDTDILGIDAICRKIMEHTHQGNA